MVLGWIVELFAGRREPVTNYKCVILLHTSRTESSFIAEFSVPLTEGQVNDVVRDMRDFVHDTPALDTGFPKTEICLSSGGGWWRRTWEGNRAELVTRAALVVMPRSTWISGYAYFSSSCIGPVAVSAQI